MYLYREAIYGLVILAMLYIIFRNINYKRLNKDIERKQKEMEKKMYFLAYYNPLTDMPNKSKFKKCVYKTIDDYKISSKKFAIMYINIDNFRRVNDTWGYEAGDTLLKHIADTMRSYAHHSCLYFHLGGDKFAIILENIDNEEDAIERANRVVDKFKEPWEYMKQKVFLTFSAGIVIYPDNGDDLYSLIVNADTAMWHVKNHGKDGLCLYSKDMQTKRTTYIQAARQIKKGLKNKEFIIHYQPQIYLDTGKIAGLEALIRWQHPEQGLVFPNDFIPLAEATGDIHAIGRFVLETVCKQKKKWQDQGYPDIVVAVNISGLSLTRGDLADEIEELLETYQINPTSIRIEVTETSVMSDVDMAVKMLNKIRKLGVKVALDDFGTGYSSLTYLRRLPLDVVKIDRTFIKNIKSTDEEEIIVEIVIQIARSLGLQVVAEGVETQEQLSYIIESDCELAQGYYFSRPKAPSQIEDILDEEFKYAI